MFRGRLGESWFLVTELKPGTVDGYVPGNLWQFINNAQPAWLPQVPGATFNVG